MLSRVADYIYWMSRYIERAENYARFCNVNFNLSLDLPSGISEQWLPLLSATGGLELYTSLYGKVSKNKVVHFLGLDEKNPNSVYNSIVNARSMARVLRPEITRELWQQINTMYYMVKNGLEKKILLKKDPRLFFRNIRKGCQLLYGIFDATISRNEAWHFGKIGQCIERADETSRVLDVKYHMLLPTTEVVGSPTDLIQWVALLKSVSAYDMYRKKNGKLTPWGISQFLIFDDSFPRAMLHCLRQAKSSMHAVTGNYTGYLNNAERQIGMLTAHLEYSNISEVFSFGLHEYLDDFQIRLNEASTAVFSTFFSVNNIIKRH